MTTPPSPDDAPGWAPPDAPSLPEPPSADSPPALPPLQSGPDPRRTNRLAITAGVTGAIGLVPFALGFAVAALVQLRSRNEKGRNYAVAGILGAGIWTIAAVVVTVMVVTSMVGVNRDESGRARKSGILPFSALQRGDCFVGPPGDRLTPVTVTPCTKPHDSEVIAAAPLPEEAYPGDKAVHADATEWCRARTAHLGKSRYFKNLRNYSLGPDRAAWNDGDRKVTCSVNYTGPGKLTSPLAQTIDPSLKYYQELKAGDCLGDFDDDSPVTATVSCTEPHKTQVYATYWLPLDAEYAPGDYPPYPGWGAVNKKARLFCAKRDREVFGERPLPVPVREGYLAPDEHNWNNGIRAIVCMARTTKPLKRSLLPK